MKNIHVTAARLVSMDNNAFVEPLDRRFENKNELEEFRDQMLTAFKLCYFTYSYEN